MASILNQILETIFVVLFFIYYAIFSYIRLATRFIFPRRKKSLDGEVFLITGSGSGIGREVAYYLAKNHPKTTLVLWDSNKVGNQQTFEAIKLLGIDVFSYTVDVTNRLQVEEVKEKVGKEVGCVTILFNNAGVVGLCDMLSMPPEDIERTINVNLMSHFWTLKAFLPDMITNSGHIVTTCSGAGFLGLRYDAPYSASKFGIRGYLESLKSELRHHPMRPSIKFTTVFPSFVRTPLIERVRYKMKLESFFKRIEPRHVAERIVEGVQMNQENVFIPKILEFLIFVKVTSPSRLFNKIEDYILEGLEFDEIVKE